MAHICSSATVPWDHTMPCAALRSLAKAVVIWRHNAPAARRLQPVLETFPVRSHSPAFAGRAPLLSARTPQRDESRTDSSTSAVPQESRGAGRSTANSLLHASLLTLPSSPDGPELAVPRENLRREGKGCGCQSPVANRSKPNHSS